MKKLNFFSFKQNLWLAIIVVFIVVLLSAGLVTHIVNKKNYESLLINRNQALLHQSSSSIEFMFGKIEQLAIQYSLHPVIENLAYVPMTSAQEYLELNKLIREISNINTLDSIVESVEIFFPETDLILSNSKYILSELETYKRDDFLLFNKLKTERIDNHLILREKITYSQNAPKKFVTYIKYFKIDKKRGLYVIVNINKNDFENAVRALTVGEARFMIIKNNEILFSSHSAESIPFDWTESLLNKNVDKQIINESLSVVSYSRLLRNQLEYVLIVPANLYHNQMKLANQDMIQFFAVIFLLGLIFSKYITNKIYTPIKKLVSNILDLEQPKSEKKLSSGTHDIPFIMSKVNNWFHEREKLQRVFQISLPDIKRSFLLRHLHGKIPHEEVNHKMVAYQIHLNQVRSAVILLKLENVSELLNEQFENRIYNYLNEFVMQSDTFSHYEFVDMDDALFSIIIGYDEQTRIQDFDTYFRKLQINMHQLFKIRVTISFGQEVESFHHIHHSFQTARHALNMKYIVGKGEIIYYHDHCDEDQSLIYPLELEINAIQAIKNADMNLLREILKQFKDGIRPNTGSDHREIQQIFTQFSLSLVKELFKGQEIDTNFIQHIINYIFSEINHERDLGEYLLSVEKLGEMLIEERKAKLDKKNTELVSSILHYIDNHFMDIISLEDIAEYFSLSSAHLGRAFKTVTGKTLLEYLTERKMNHSMNLLLETDTPIYDIAEQLGYANVKSFSRMFKNQMGMTPNEYRVHGLG